MISSSSNIILEVRNLSASVAGVGILKGINLTVRAGEVHAIMGAERFGKKHLLQSIGGTSQLHRNRR